MIRVGVAGLGMMGRTHLEVYRRRRDVEVVAVADCDPARLAGAAAGSNIAALGAAVLDLGGVRRYTDAEELILDPGVDLVDICLPTPLHAAAVRAAIAAGKHVLVEKPPARTAAEARALADLAERASTITMPALCMRFWPGWTWLKEAVDRGTWGRPRGVSFQRLGAVLPGASYRDSAQSGGAILDLHLHDTDFVRHLFGWPRAVTSFGYSHLSGEIDHVLTRYDYAAADLVTAEGAWMASAGFPFTMRYVADFEHATATYDFAADPPLVLYRRGRPPEPVPLEAGLGYDHEIAYLLDCIHAGCRPERATMAAAAAAVAIVEMESRSVKTGRTVEGKAS
ncbi:MAG: Gfo/Idh/MocA family oxidoreductase [Planctomycetes bacterium]|nr:Gfo/Idh/MocA family oxidoreductase [Planctomycetota bacterium]